MNKITHGIFLIFTFQILFLTQINAQYLDTKTSKLPLSFLNSQYWENNYSSVNDSIEIVKSNWILRVAHKFAFGLLIGGGGGFLSIYLSYQIFSYYGPLFVGPISYALFSSMGVKMASNNYGNETPFGILLLAGLSGMALGGGIGFMIEDITDENTFDVPALIGAIVFGIVAEVAVSEINYSNISDADWDEYIYNETDKLVFHEYVKSKQVFNFELFRIQL